MSVSPEVTLADFDAVRAAIIRHGNYRQDCNGIAANVDVLSRAVLAALIERRWQPAARGEGK